MQKFLAATERKQQEHHQQPFLQEVVVLGPPMPGSAAPLAPGSTAVALCVPRLMAGAPLPAPATGSRRQQQRPQQRRQARGRQDRGQAAATTSYTALLQGGPVSPAPAAPCQQPAAAEPEPDPASLHVLPVVAVPEVTIWPQPVGEVVPAAAPTCVGKLTSRLGGTHLGQPCTSGTAAATTATAAAGPGSVAAAAAAVAAAAAAAATAAVTAGSSDAETTHHSLAPRGALPGTNAGGPVALAGRFHAEQLRLEEQAQVAWAQQEDFIRRAQLATSGLPAQRERAGKTTAFLPQDQAMDTYWRRAARRELAEKKQPFPPDYKPRPLPPSFPGSLRVPLRPQPWGPGGPQEQQQTQGGGSSREEGPAGRRSLPRRSTRSARRVRDDLYVALDSDDEDTKETAEDDDSDIWSEEEEEEEADADGGESEEGEMERLSGAGGTAGTGAQRRGGSGQRRGRQQQHPAQRQRLQLPRLQQGQQQQQRQQLSRHHHPHRLHQQHPPPQQLTPVAPGMVPLSQLHAPPTASPRMQPPTTQQQLRSQLITPQAALLSAAAQSPILSPFSMFLLDQQQAAAAEAEAAAAAAAAAATAAAAAGAGGAASAARTARGSRAAGGARDAPLPVGTAAAALPLPPELVAPGEMHDHIDFPAIDEFLDGLDFTNDELLAALPPLLSNLLPSSPAVAQLASAAAVAATPTLLSRALPRPDSLACSDAAANTAAEISLDAAAVMQELERAAAAGRSATDSLFCSTSGATYQPVSTPMPEQQLPMPGPLAGRQCFALTTGTLPPLQKTPTASPALPTLMSPSLVCSFLNDF